MLALRNRFNALTPKPTTILIISIIFITIASYLISFNLWKTLFYFILPYIIVNLMDYGTVKISHNDFSGKKIMMVNLTIMIISIVQFSILHIFFSTEFSLFLAFSSPVFMRVIVYLIFMRKTPVIGIITSLYYNIIYGVIIPFMGASYAIPFIISSGIYLLAGFPILKITRTSFLKEFGEDPLWFVSSFINYISTHSKDSVDTLNRFFEGIYRERTVPISTLAFWDKDSPKAIFVFPYIHPGPFDGIGGSNITEKLKNASGLSNLFVFHTTTTHDNNIADNDVKKIAKSVKNSLNKNQKFDKMSDMHRFKLDNIEVMVQVFGKYMIIALLPIQDIFDDVDLESGMKLREKLLKYYEDSAIIDAHNNFDEHATPLFLNDDEINKIIEKVKNIKADAPIRMGYAQRTFKGRSIGPDGIKVAVFDYNGKKIGYILMDGNNIKKGFRDKVRKSLKGLLDDVEIFSTDNHIVNNDLTDLNPVGERDPWDYILSLIKDAVIEATKNITSTKVSMQTENVQLKMAVSGQMDKINDITRGVLKKAKIVTPILVLVSFTSALLSFLYL